jgi:hypothetical protein
MKITRYDVVYMKHFLDSELMGGGVGIKENGSFVKYEDYKKLWDLLQRIKPPFGEIKLPEA